MTNAAKWKEFLRWWEQEMRDVAKLLYNTNIVLLTESKIGELKKGDNVERSKNKC